MEEEIKRLRWRASVMRMQSYVVLLLVVGTIGIGSYFFYFAGQLAEDKLEGVVADLLGLRQSVSEALDRSREELTQIGVDYSTSRLAIDQSSDRLISSTIALAEKVDSIAAEVRDVDAFLRSLETLNLEQVRSSLEADLERASRQLISTSDDVVQTLREEWTQQGGKEADLPIGCAITGKSSAISEFDEIECPFEDYPPSHSAFATCFGRATSDVTTGIPTTTFTCRRQLFSVPEPNFIGAVSPFMSVLVEMERGLEVFDQAEVKFSTLEVSAAPEIDSFVGSFEELRSLTDSFPGSELPDSINIDLGILQSLSDTLSEIESASQSMSFFGIGELTEDQSFYNFVDETTIRVTVVVLIIFLVQILVNLFRYSTRLAGFYDARADALKIAINSGISITSSDFHALVMSLAPDNIDFGRGQKSPIDSAVELSRQIVSVGKSQGN